MIEIWDFEKIRFLRKEFEITYDEIGDEIGVSKQAICNMFNGRTSIDRSRSILLTLALKDILEERGYDINKVQHEYKVHIKERIKELESLLLED